jgi:hypothetical protein
MFANPLAILFVLSAAALFVHGYHLGVDDAEIYLPAIKKAADPALFPFASEFFMSHAHLSFFPNLVGGFARLTRIPADTAIFLCQAAGIYLLLLAGWRLACVCFEHAPARWAGVSLLAAAFSVPVAGTSLVIQDPYVTARTLSAPATLFAVACYLSHKPIRAAGWLVFTALIHPQMSVYGAVLLVCLAAPAIGPRARFALALPFLWDFHPATGPAREALLSRTYFFVTKWAWYEWVGVFAPLAILSWFSFRPLRGTTTAFQRLARTLVPFGLLFTAASLVLALVPNLENFTRLQPMRSFHLVYMIFFVLLGGGLGEYVLGGHAWRWAAVFVPVAVGIWALQAASYPFSPRVEWPGTVGGGNWGVSFLWIRGHTPRDAVFALDPNYLAVPEDDQHGFRALAERSVLADNLKDSGAVSLFPQLAADWKAEVLAQTGWQHFRLADFEHLAQQYPVTWIVARRPAPAGLTCPYENQELAVCRISAR